ncbi:MAG: hypothetical protein RTU30_04275 [Candidatus Thorarchaeota archaeon]
MSAPALLVEIEQIGASIVIEQSLDLEVLSKGLNVPLSNVGDTPVLVYKFKEQNEISFLVFSTGKMMCTGSKSEKEVEQAVDSFMKILRYVGVKNTETRSFEIQNVIALGRLGVELDLKTVVKTLENCRLALSSSALGERLSFVTQYYRLESFPWLLYGLRYPKVAIVLFGSGKFVITGAKSEKMSHEAAENFKVRLTELGII